MFKRRKQQPVHHRVGNLIWPRMGWGRVVVYLWHRVGRLHGTPHSIAGGFASGAAISITPFVGIHFILAALVSWSARGNIIAGLIGTAVGNPWTFPFIWWWTYTLGNRMGAGGSLSGHDPNFLAIFTKLPGVLMNAMLKFQIDGAYFENVWAVIGPMMLGSIPTFVVVWLATYLLLKPFVTAYQARRIARRRRKLKREREREREEKAHIEGDFSEAEIVPMPDSAPVAEAAPANRKSNG